MDLCRMAKTVKYIDWKNFLLLDIFFLNLISGYYIIIDKKWHTAFI